MPRFCNPHLKRNWLAVGSAHPKSHHIAIPAQTFHRDFCRSRPSVEARAFILENIEDHSPVEPLFGPAQIYRNGSYAFEVAFPGSCRRRETVLALGQDQYREQIDVECRLHKDPLLVIGAGNPAQGHLRFFRLALLSELWGGPPGPRPTPGSASS